MLGWGRGVQDAWDVWGQGDATHRLKPLGCIWMPPLFPKSQTPGVLRVPSAPAGSAPGDWFRFCRRQRLSPNATHSPIPSGSLPRESGLAHVVPSTCSAIAASLGLLDWSRGHSWATVGQSGTPPRDPPIPNLPP